MTSPTSASPLPAPAYPLQLDLVAPDQITRWRPLVQWLLAIPHFVVLYVLVIVQRVVLIISFFAILFTGKMPEGLFGFNAMVLRYQWRVASYAAFMREPYPEFAFPMEPEDPATEAARVSLQPSPRLSRGLIFVKWLLAVPHYIVLFFLFIAAYIAIIIAFFAVIITGTWPAGMRDFVVGVMRWAARVNMYILLMTDRYPPFTLA
ncbi:MAG: DUF4389 domain-containing protein [Acidimicrobiales bacterium]